MGKMSLRSIIIGQKQRAQFPSNVRRQLEVAESHPTCAYCGNTEEQQNGLPMSVCVRMARSRTHKRRVGQKHMKSGVGSYFCKYLKSQNSSTYYVP